MKEETLKELGRINENLTTTIERTYGKWCCSVLSTLYTDLGPGDKIHILVYQPAKNRPILAPFVNEASQCVLLNINPEAVLRFSMDFKGLTFECGLRGQVFFDTIEWEEIAAFEVRNGGWVKYQVPLNTEDAILMVDTLTTTRGIVADPLPLLESDAPSNNVVQVQFGNKG